MHPTTPSDRDMLSKWFTQAVQSDLRECRALAQDICDEATAACARAAEIRYESAQRRHRAQELRTRHAQLCAAGVRRRQDALTQGSCPLSAVERESMPQILKESILPHEDLTACHPQQR